jgi:hypothetical protein
MQPEISECVLHTINYFRKNYITQGIEINYQMIDDQTIKFKIPKSEYNNITQKLKNDNIDFQVIPTDRKMELLFPQHSGKKLLKTKFLTFNIYFVEFAALKNVENIKNSKEMDIKNWSDFFDTIDPEYRNLLLHIINGIPIATHKNEYNKVVSKKIYWIDPKDGLFEKKEKFVNDEWVISYHLITNNLYHVFRMFFKYFDEPELKELVDFEKFKNIISNTKYKIHLSSL